MACWACLNALPPCNTHNQDCPDYRTTSIYNNFFAFVTRTDTQHWGHEYVVLFASTDLKTVTDFRAEYSKWIEVKEGMLVKLCSDSKAVPGALVCTDEFN